MCIRTCFCTVWQFNQYWLRLRWTLKHMLWVNNQPRFLHMQNNVWAKQVTVLMSTIHNAFWRHLSQCLEIEILRWAGIDRDHRKCNLCDKRDIGDEFHYLLSCSFYANTRRGLLPSCYLQHPNCIVFKNVLNEKDELKLTNTCKLISVILKQFPSPGGN